MGSHPGGEFDKQTGCHDQWNSSGWDGANHVQETKNNTGTVVEMVAFATWVVQVATDRKIVVQLRQHNAVEGRRTESDGFRPRVKVSHLSNMTSYGGPSEALVGQPIAEAVEVLGRHFRPDTAQWLARI